MVGSDVGLWLLQCGLRGFTHKGYSCHCQTAPGHRPTIRHCPRSHIIRDILRAFQQTQRAALRLSHIHSAKHCSGLSCDCLPSNLRRCCKGPRCDWLRLACMLQTAAGAGIKTSIGHKQALPVLQVLDSCVPSLGRFFNWSLVSSHSTAALLQRPAAG